MEKISINAAMLLAPVFLPQSVKTRTQRSLFISIRKQNKKTCVYIFTSYSLYSSAGEWYSIRNMLFCFGLMVRVRFMSITTNFRVH